MNDRKKEIIIKLVLVLVCIFDLLLVIIPIFVAIFCNGHGEQIEIVNGQQNPLPQPYYTIWVVDAILAGFFGCAFMILLPVFGLKQKPIKAEKMILKFNDFNSLSNHIQDSAVKSGYKRQPILTFVGDGTLAIYIKQNSLWQDDCIVLVRIEELTDEVLSSANDAITESLKAYHGKNRITNTVSMITIICVDRITPSFQKYVNGNIQQGFKNFRLLVGISFGGMSIYVARQKDGFAITKYKKLRRKFLKIMQIDN